MKNVTIIGSGFSSLAASCYLAKKGYNITVYEKNKHLGGRARQLKKDGFIFDMGPTFYWMPDVFEKFFADFGYHSSDFYQLEKLNPSYRVYFENGEFIDIADNFEDIKKTFESIEPNSAKKLERFIDKSKDNYNVAIQDLVYKPGENILEIVTPTTVKKIGSFFRTINHNANKTVRNKNLRKILKFPVLFLGSKPSNTPSFYNFMNYADFKLGTWYPKGGMYEVVKAMVSIAESLGVVFYTSSTVNKINVIDKEVSSIIVNGKNIKTDLVLSGADYAFTETLLPKIYQQYNKNYWKHKTFAPAALLFYVGFNCKLNNIKHHTLFFDTDFEEHAKTIYDTHSYPKNPLFYASFPSKTDENCAPKNTESAIFLIPLSIDLEDNELIRTKLFDNILNRLEKVCKQNLKKFIIFKEIFGINDFKADYNSYGGNAYGLANTLLQTHVLRPKLSSKKVKNLFFTGQLTVPGPGVPPSLISGKIVSDLINKYHPLKH